MNKKLKYLGAIIAMASFLYFAYYTTEIIIEAHKTMNEAEAAEEVVIEEPVEIDIPIEEEIEEEIQEEDVIEEEIIEEVEIVEEVEPHEEPITVEEGEIEIDDIELLAWICIAEAEGQAETTQRLVIDTVLNRVDNTRFPNTIKDVIYQKNQFSCTFDGRMNRCAPTDDARRLVREELEHRTESKVMFFRTDHFFDFGTPLYNIDNVYFSGL